MNIKQIQELIKFVAKSVATEVDLEMGDVKICIKSPPKGKIIQDSPTTIVPLASVPTPTPPVSPPQTPPPSIPDASILENTKEDSATQTTNDHHLIVKSPIIGTFYRRPSPDKDPFVNVGDKIDIGSVVGIVEAMKLFNEIESEVSGTIIKVLVDDMSPVEYDQPLFLVDTN